MGLLVNVVSGGGKYSGTEVPGNGDLSGKNFSADGYPFLEVETFYEWDFWDWSVLVMESIKIGFSWRWESSFGLEVISASEDSENAFTR